MSIPACRYPLQPIADEKFVASYLGWVAVELTLACGHTQYRRQSDVPKLAVRCYACKPRPPKPRRQR